MRKTLRAMVQVQYWCGMRPGEVCTLQPGDVDRSGAIWLYRPQRHKTRHLGKKLIKAIPQPAQEILTPYLFGPSDKPAFLAQQWRGKQRPYTNETYGAAIRRAASRAKVHGLPVEPWSPNQLRHAILTDIANKLGREDAKTWAGHSEQATTLIYTWTATADLTRIADELGRREAG
jgi:integrase